MVALKAEIQAPWHTDGRCEEIAKASLVDNDSVDQTACNDIGAESAVRDAAGDQSCSECQYQCDRDSVDTEMAADVTIGCATTH